jgi:hypothetical protein
MEKWMLIILLLSCCPVYGLYYGVDNAKPEDFPMLKQHGVNVVQVIVQENDITTLNTYLSKAEETDMHLIVWLIGPNYCGANCIPWKHTGGGWTIDSSVEPLLTRLGQWERGEDLLLGVNAFQEPHNDGITLAQQADLARMLRDKYGIPITDWIDNVVDTGARNHADWLAAGGDSIDWPITWTHCIPYYKGTGGNTCPELTCELANPSNMECCKDQWASACRIKCYGPEGTCAYGLEKIRQDTAIVGSNYGVLLQSFEMAAYNNAHVPYAEQMYEEACRIAKSGYVDLMIWYDWDKTYSGYTGDLHSQRYDPSGADRWAMLKKIYDECIASCGDGLCGIGESCSSCAIDCPCGCTPDWSCTNWSLCYGAIQVRSCKDLSNCGSSNGRPDESRSCLAQCLHEADCNPCDFCISHDELFAYIANWKSGQTILENLMEAIGKWKNGC